MAEPKYEDNPVLTRLIVRADGSRSVGLRVFCRRQARSFTLDYCRECPQCFEVVGEGASAVVRCKPPVGAEDHPVCPVSLDGVAVGAMLKQEVLCVSHDLPVQDLTMLVAERSLANVFVVDGDRGLVGVVRETDLLDASRRLASYTGRRTWPPGTTAASVMTRELRRAGEHAGQAGAPRDGRRSRAARARRHAERRAGGIARGSRRNALARRVRATRVVLKAMAPARWFAPTPIPAMPRPVITSSSSTMPDSSSLPPVSVPPPPSSKRTLPSEKTFFWDLLSDLSVQIEWLEQVIAGVKEPAASSTAIEQVRGWANALRDLHGSIDRVQAHIDDPRFAKLFAFDGPLAAFLSRLFAWCEEISKDFEQTAVKLRRNEPVLAVFQQRAVNESLAEFQQLSQRLRESLVASRPMTPESVAAWKTFDSDFEELLWATEWLHLSLSKTPGA